MAFQLILDAGIKGDHKPSLAQNLHFPTIEQSEKEFSSLDGQKTQCDTWLDMKNAGSENSYEVFKIYTDTKSGKNLNRPGMKQLRKDASDGKFGLMITTKLDRLLNFSLKILTDHQPIFTRNSLMI